MNLKYIIKICSVILSFCSFGIMFAGFFKMKKAVGTLQIGKEVAKETEALAEKGLGLVKLGGILTATFGIIAILFS